MNFEERRPRVHVVAGAVINALECVLIAQRPPGSHLAGGWEFPGGKLEPGEERAAGLARELHEELGITVATARPLMRVSHAYPRREILLDMWVVKRYSGEPRGLDGQALRWCTMEDLAWVDLLPADAPIVRALRLPERLTEVASRDYTIGHEVRGPIAPGLLRGVFCADIAAAAAAVRAGAEFLVMQKPLADAELAAFCESTWVPVYAHGIGLDHAWLLGASGLNEIRDAGGRRRTA